jgi:hypothetical protein
MMMNLCPVSESNVSLAQHWKLPGRGVVANSILLCIHIAAHLFWETKCFGGIAFIFGGCFVGCFCLWKGLAGIIVVLFPHLLL